MKSYDEEVPIKMAAAAEALTNGNNSSTTRQQQQLVSSNRNNENARCGAHRYAERHPNYECLSIQSDSLSPPSSSSLSPIILDEQQQSSSGSKTTKLCGRLLLILVAFLYSTLNVVLRRVYELPDPPSASVLSCTRGWLAAILFVPILYLQQHQQHHADGDVDTSEPSRHDDDDDDDNGLVLPVVEVQNRPPRSMALMGLALGLLTIESARASFIVETSVAITPIISKLAGHPVKWTAWAGCFIALLGLVCLSDTSQGLGHFGFGDILCFFAAFCWSMYIFRLSFCQLYDEVQLQAVKTLLLAILYSLWVLAAWISSDEPLWRGYASLVAWALLLYSAIGPGALGDILQQKGQIVVSAAEGNVILSMEPVFTALEGFVLLGEELSWQEMLGGGLIVIAAVVATQS